MTASADQQVPVRGVVVRKDPWIGRPTNPRTTPLSDDDWENVKAKLRDLRLAKKKMPVKDLVPHMEKEHGFIATKDQYNKKFKDWGWSKPHKPVVIKQDTLPNRQTSSPGSSAGATPPSQSQQELDQASSRNRSTRAGGDRGGCCGGPTVFIEKAHGSGSGSSHKRPRVPTSSGNATPDTHSPARSSTTTGSHSQGLDDRGNNTTPPSLISDTDTTCSRTHKRARTESYLGGNDDEDAFGEAEDVSAPMREDSADRDFLTTGMNRNYMAYEPDEKLEKIHPSLKVGDAEMESFVSTAVPNTAGDMMDLFFEDNSRGVPHRLQMTAMEVDF